MSPFGAVFVVKAPACSVFIHGEFIDRLPILCIG